MQTERESGKEMYSVSWEERMVVHSTSIHRSMRSKGLFMQESSLDCFK